MQTKLTVNTPGDIHEQEADRVATYVMNVKESRPNGISAASAQLQRKCGCGGSCSDCKPKEELPAILQRKDAGPAPVALPSVVQRALHSPGELIDTDTRTFMEHRFGHDFSSVRLHNDEHANASAAALNAHAFTVGDHIAFRSGAYFPSSHEGRTLLAHELTHVVQQRMGRSGPQIQRFAASETNRIAQTYSDMLAQVRELIAAATTSGLIGDDLNMSYFVEIAGGSSAGRALDKKLGSDDPTIKSRLLRRYIYTCRCGLIDMRHFIQLLYISNFAAGFEGVSQQGANRYATRKGREHEIEAESESRFGAEDTPSNALGALTNVGLAATPGPNAVYDAIKDTLDRCDPVDWKSLSKPSQDMIVKFYSETVPDPSPRTSKDKVIPKNQEQSAVPTILGVSECAGKERSLPFRIDTDDSDRKTLAGRDFLAGSTGLKKGKEVKAFVNTQRPEIIKGLPLSEKIRLLNILLDPPVDDDDRAAIKIIYHNSTVEELRAEPPT